MSATATKITRPWWQVALPGANDVLGSPGGTLGGNPNAKPGDPDWRGSVDYTAGSLPGGPSTFDGFPLPPFPGGQTPGNTWSAPSTQVPYTAPSTTGGAGGGSGPFGYTYGSPGAGFNPWGLYDGRDNYDGTAGDGVGLYNAQADTAKGWGPNGRAETDRDRVWRMTLDDLKAKGLDPGSADPRAVQAAFLNNVARLHRDYDNTPGLGAQAWANSAFAGYDRLAGGQGGTGARPTGVLNTALDLPAGTTTGAGGSTVGPNDPTNPYNNPGAPQGASPAIPSGTPTPTAATTVNANGQSVPLGAYYASNPTNAVNQFLASKGVQIGSHDPWSEFLRTLATGIGKTLPQIVPNGPNGLPANDTLANLPQQLNDLIYGNGGQVFSNIGGYADKALAALTPQINAGMKSTDVEGMLQLIQMLKSAGENPFQKSFNAQQLTDLFNQYNQQAQTQGMAGHPLSASWYLQNDPFGLYGAATGQPR